MRPPLPLTVAAALMAVGPPGTLSKMAPFPPIVHPDGISDIKGSPESSGVFSKPIGEKTGQGAPHAPSTPSTSKRIPDRGGGSRENKEEAKEDDEEEADVVIVPVSTKTALLKAPQGRKGGRVQTEDDSDQFSYQWRLGDDAPASMMFVGVTATQRDAIVSGISQEGRWNIEVRVTDRRTNGSSTHRVLLRVEKDPSDEQSVEVLIGERLVNEWNQRDRRWISSCLSSALTSSVLSPEMTTLRVEIREMARLPLDGRWRVVFYVVEESAGGEERQVARAREIVSLLRSRASALSELAIERVEALHCDLECSRHGTCDPYTKRCVCDAWWMPSPFAWLRAGFRAEDCSWSATRSTAFVLVIGGVVALAALATKKHKSRRALMQSRRAARRRQRYEYLRSEEDGGKRGCSRPRHRSSASSSLGAPNLVALPPRSWSSSSLESDDADDPLLVAPRPPLKAAQP